MIERLPDLNRDGLEIMHSPNLSPARVVRQTDSVNEYGTIAKGPENICWGLAFAEI